MTDGSVLNAEELRLQLGYVILKIDDSGTCDIVHFCGNKCKRIARSVMAAEVQALILGLDSAFLVKELSKEQLCRTWAL